MISTDEREVMAEKSRDRRLRRTWCIAFAAVFVAVALAVALTDGVGDNVPLVVLLLVGAAGAFVLYLNGSWRRGSVTEGLALTRVSTLFPALVMGASGGLAFGRLDLGAGTVEDLRWSTLGWPVAVLLVLAPLALWWDRERIVLTRDGITRVRRSTRARIGWDEVESAEFTADGKVRVRRVGPLTPDRTDAPPAEGFTVPTFDAGIYPSSVRDALSHWAHHPEARSELGTPAALDRLRAD